MNKDYSFDTPPARKSDVVDAEFEDTTPKPSKPVKVKPQRSPVERVAIEAIHGIVLLIVAMLVCKALYGVTLW